MLEGSMVLGKSQEEGQEDQGDVKEPGENQPYMLEGSMFLLAFLLALPQAPWNSPKGSTFNIFRT